MRIGWRALVTAIAMVLSIGTVACGGGDQQTTPDEDPTADDGEQQARSIVLYEYQFNPNELRVQKGTEVTFENKDPERHNVNIPALDIDENIDPGEEWSHTFDTTGEFAVENRLATTPMTMTLVVE